LITSGKGTKKKARRGGASHYFAWSIELRASCSDIRCPW